MFNKSCTILTQLPKQRVRQWLNYFETVIFDADGVLWHFDQAAEGAVDAFNLLKATGRQIFIATNNSSLTCENIMKKANSLGFEPDDGHVITSASSIATYLATKGFSKKVYVVGEPGIRDELTQQNICNFSIEPEPTDEPMHEFAKRMELDPDVGAVVVGKDDSFTVQAIIRACSYLSNQRVLFLGTCMDAGFPIDKKRVLVGAAAMIAAVKTISGRKPLILGKPNPWMLHWPKSCGVINPETTLMVGDTLRTDILFAHNNGFQSLLVGSGVNSLKDVERLRNSGNDKLKNQIPDAYLPSLVHLLEFLC
ncbi:hypothetical protein KR222_008604 [Zaprionus bogoriensis]|nr:hypothetical protein KR222_008604 [Zaprionus bogoriensis]